MYVGDTNVTVGKPFWIQCLGEEPIDWYKDDQPIQQLHFIRHSKDDYSYVQQDEPFANSRFMKSTISVKHALKMHDGKYKCSLKHEKSHVLHVHDAESAIVELDSENGSLEDEYDDDKRRVSFEPPIIGEDALKSTMMMYVEEVSESNRVYSSNFEDSYEQLRVNSMEKVSDKMYEFEDVVVTTKAMVSTTTTPEPVTTTTHRHELKHHHNKHQIHESWDPHDSHETKDSLNEHEDPLRYPHNPLHSSHDSLHESQSIKHQNHENHVLPTQQSHETDPTPPLTTEHTATTTRQHHEGSHELTPLGRGFFVRGAWDSN